MLPARSVTLNDLQPYTTVLSSSSTVRIVIQFSYISSLCTTRRRSLFALLLTYHVSRNKMKLNGQLVSCAYNIPAWCLDSRVWTDTLPRRGVERWIEWQVWRVCFHESPCSAGCSSFMKRTVDQCESVTGWTLSKLYVCWVDGL